MILGMLDTAPTFRSYIPEEAVKYGGYFLSKWLPKSLDDWEMYCKTVVEHYKGTIDHWEIWNEPYFAMFFGRKVNDSWNGKQAPGKSDMIRGTPEEYAALAKRAFSTVRSANPNAKVLWAARKHQPDHSTAWSELVIKGGIFDVEQGGDDVTIHEYTPKMIGYPKDDVAAYYHANKTAFSKEVLDRYIFWNTEGGPGHSWNHYYHRSPPYDMEKEALFMAAYIPRYYLTSIANGVEKFFLYSYASSSWSGGWSVLGLDGSLPPNGTALSAFAWHVEGKRYLGVSEVKEGTFAYFFEDDNEIVAVLANKPGTATRLASHSDDVTVRDHYGNTQALGKEVRFNLIYFTGSMSRDSMRNKVIGMVK